MKLAIFCMVILVCLVAAKDKVRHGPQYMWTIRADTFVHRTFEEGSPNAHYYYLKISRAELMQYAENVHVIVNEISDPDADIKLYIKPNSREELLDLTAEGIREYRTLHAELFLDSPAPPVSKFSVAVVCNTPGVEYSVSACLGEDCSETSTAGLKAQPRHPRFPKPIRKKVEEDRSHNRQLLQNAAKKKKTSGTTEKRAFPPPPEEIMSPVAAETAMVSQVFNAPTFSYDKSGFDGGAFMDGDVFVDACNLVHTTGNAPFRSFIQRPFDQTERVITYDFGAEITLSGLCLWAGEAEMARIVTTDISVSVDNTLFTPVLMAEAVPPTTGVAEAGIPIDFMMPVVARYVRLDISAVPSPGSAGIGEIAGRVVPPEPPIVPVCEGSNCQCAIPGCEVEMLSTCTTCTVCENINRADCRSIDEALDINGNPRNRGIIEVRDNDACVVIDTIVQSVVGVRGRNCIILTENADVVLGITGGPRADCVINEGGTVSGIINLAGDDDCYIGTDASTGRINGQGGNDMIIVNGGDTSAPGDAQQLNGGADNDCISITGAFIGLINAAGGDDCVFVHSMAETARIRGQDGNDHISVSDSVAAEIDGQEGDDIIEVDMGSEVDGPVAGGVGSDEIYVMGSDVNGDITTETENDIVVVEGPMAVFDVIDTGEGDDCIEVREASSLFDIDSIIGGLGDDSIYTFANDRMGNIRGNEGCDTVVSCNNGANSGIGPIDTVDAGDDEDRCVVNESGSEEVLGCESNVDTCLTLFGPVPTPMPTVTPPPP